MKNRFFLTFQSLILLTVFSLIICSNANANWWDKFGEPKYGGKLNIQIGRMPAQIDTIIAFPAFYLYEPLFNWDWTLDQEKEYSYTNRWVPPEYWTGNLAETWEWENPQTVVIHLRKGIHWQDKPPVNGREFTAHDVAHHYHRLMGNGSGYTKPSPTLAGFYAPYDTVTAIDDYTVVIKFKKPSIVVNTMNLFDPILQNFEPPEVAKEVEIIKDWRQVVSTGPWILTDFVEGGAVTLARNPNYWAYDEKFPKNQLPYLDEVRILSISDIATAISALRTNKLSILSELTWQQADTLSKSNPEFKKAKVPRQAPDLQLRVDKKPFTDIRVRKALQLALDRPLIAKTFFGGMSEGKPCGIMWPEYDGWVMPYDKWPRDLKDQYGYDPEKAKKLLSEAGYPNGFKTHVAADSTGDMALLEVIKAQFLDIGVDMEIRAMDGHALRSMLNSHKLEQIYYQWSPAGQAPSIAVRTVATNHPHLQHGDMNYVAIVEEFEKAKSLDEAKKRAIDADMYYLNQHWSVVLFPTYSFTFWQPNLKGYLGERNTLAYLGTPAQGALSWARLWFND